MAQNSAVEVLDAFARAPASLRYSLGVELARTGHHNSPDPRDPFGIDWLCSPETRVSFDACIGLLNNAVWAIIW
eukprot:3741679-Amphidinium_carterae.1